MGKKKKVTIDPEPQLLRRAYVAWYKSGGTAPPTTSYVTTHKGLSYVVVQNAGRIVVYRIKNDGMLRALRRWPHQVERWPEHVEHPVKGAK
jgi:hypothetical protein